jgi:hypothetical protein
MKTDCEKYDECRLPGQVCNAKCPDYEPRKRDKKADCANVGEHKTGSPRLRIEHII